MRQFFKKWFKAKPKGPIASTGPLPSRSRIKRISTAIRRKVPRDLRDFDIRKVNADTVAQHSGLLKLGLLIMAVFIASGISSRIIALFIRPSYTPLPTKKIGDQKNPSPTEDYYTIEQRNIFDVEGRIPDPFDQGLLDCMSQAKISTQKLTLLGTVVMNNENLSVALLQEEGAPDKTAVKKEDTFAHGKFVALKVERKKLCFQNKETQDFEYIEIPEEGGDLGVTPLGGGKYGEGITPITDTQYVVKQTFLDKELGDLNNVLQTAKAVPYMDNNKMKGFLIQSIDPDSPFAQLGLKPGDVLSGVNDIVLDNAGKGLEAFQRLRNSNRIELKVIRGGQEVPLSYEVK